jgi:3-dehydroquinate dehydratase-1
MNWEKGECEMGKTIKIKGYEIGEHPLVCVPVVAGTRDEILRQFRKLAGAGTQMIEWRMDWYEAVDDREQTLALARELKEICRETLLLVTYRSREQGGEGELERGARDELLLALAKSGTADLIDVEYYAHAEPTQMMQRLKEAGAVLVASHHDFAQTPGIQEMETMLSTMQGGGADIVKLAVMPKCREDVANLLLVTARFKDKYDTPLITMSMGSQGIISRVAGESLGSCVTFGADGKASAPGQMAKEDLEMTLKLLHQSMTGGEENIYLIGFMGVGKSTVAHALQRLCGMEIIDMDEELVKRAGKSIPEIFDTEGQEAFRNMETALLQELAARKNHIVSCGGGAILREANRRLMRDSGMVVELTAEPEIIWERVKDDDSRPVLAGKKNVPAIRLLMEERRGNYELARDVSVPTDGRTALEIASEILERMRERS